MILTLLILSICSISFAATNVSKKIAIIPYINSTEESKDYIEETINDNYHSYFFTKNLEMISPIEVKKALVATGYDASNLELPEKETMEELAKATGANYVIAMELSQLNTTRHMSFFQAKVVTKTKLRYKFYNAEQNKAVSFQVTGDSENKTIFGDVGYKDPITKALTEAMDKANEKITDNF